jgi:hypothetical protein
MSLVQAVSAQPQIAAALQNASAQTGVDFSYLLNTAMRESSLNCSAKSNTSSACGLFQFTRQTWLGTMKQSGASLGLGQYASAITQDASGRYTVADPAVRKEILALRNDPQVSALMAGAYTAASKDRLESSLGRSVSQGELYVAHFLGAGGATKLISAAEDTPNSRADVLFPEAAAANRSIFYDKAGQPKTVAEVYNNLVSKHGGGAPGFEIAPQPELADANGDASGSDGASNDVQTLGTLASALSGTTPVRSSGTQASTTASGATNGLGGRSPLKLSPAVLRILSSLDVPGSEKSTTSPANSDEDRKAEHRIMLPRSGFAFG